MHSPTGLEVNTQNIYTKYSSQAPTQSEDGLQLGEPYMRYYGDKPSSGEMKVIEPPEPRVCGLSRKTFWILVAAALVIITAAALGGGLGAGLSNNKSSTTYPQQTSAAAAPVTSAAGAISSTNTASASASTTSPTADLVVTAQVGTVGGTPVTLYRDCPSTNNSLYSVQYSSTTYEYRKLCNSTFTNGGLASVNWVNQPATSLNECINLCAAWNENNVTKSNAGQVCSSVCWRYGFAGDDYPGQCFGFTTLNATSGGFSTEPDGRCDSAVWINQL